MKNISMAAAGMALLFAMSPAKELTFKTGDAKMHFNGMPGNGQVTLNWLNPAKADYDSVLIEYAPGEGSVRFPALPQTAIIKGLANGTAYNFTLSAERKGGKIEKLAVVSYTPAVPKVYFTRKITPESLLAVYRALGRAPRAGDKVGVKISTGESDRTNHLRPEFIGKLVKEVHGDIIECNTAYPGNRSETKEHYELARRHGYMDIAKVVLMDEKSEVAIPVRNPKHIPRNYVGAHFPEYTFHVVLSHFKGHQMAGYGGALKNMSIGYASSHGKGNIHTAGKGGSMFEANQDSFLESMAEAAKSIVDYAGSENFVYINVMNRMSVDCDCNGDPAEPTMKDIGIVASLDPVAADKAALDFVDKAKDGADLRERIKSRNGRLTTFRAAEIGLGSLDYELVDIDKSKTK